MEMSREIAKKVLATVDAGLVQGLGSPVPGQMCVEAALNYALGREHSDNGLESSQGLQVAGREVAGAGGLEPRQ